MSAAGTPDDNLIWSSFQNLERVTKVGALERGATVGKLKQPRLAQAALSGCSAYLSAHPEDPLPVKRSTLYTLAAVFAVAALFFFMTTARAKVRCRVCMEYRGRTNCAAAVGPTEQAAREGAQSTACGPIASGMNQQMGCGRTEPVSVHCQPKWL